MSRIHFLFGLALMVSVFPHSARAADILLNFTSAPTSTYYEYSSDGFARMDLFSPAPNDTKQGLHQISDPDNIWNVSFDAFPNDANFRFGSISYTDTVSGNGEVSITNLTLGIERDPSNSSYVNFNRWTPTLTNVVSYNGTVTLVNGNPTAVNLTSNILLNFGVSTAPKTDFAGTFNISGTEFQLSVIGDHTFVIPPSGATFRVNGEWDFSGNFTNLQAVPEPTTYAMLGLGLGMFGLASARARRRRSRK